MWVLSQGFGPDFLVIADCYNAFGGDTPDPALFSVNNLHPNSLGSNVLGKTMARALMAARATL